ncbi:MAG: OmpH/Skp family outer membrane protein [Planctomycetota bacterium]|jgi:Skp family chaperone for outer membrane proteins
MKNWILGLFVACLVLPIVWAQGGGPANPAEKVEVLILDLQGVIQNCDEQREKIAAIRKRVAENRQRMEAEIKGLQENNQSVLKTTISERDEKWYSNVESLLGKELKLKSEAAYFNIKTGDEYARMLNALIRGAQKEARDIMKERGAKMVIMSKMGPIALETEEQWKDEIINRAVICSDKTVDITDEVRRRMNAWWAQNKPAKPAQPVKPGK